MECSRTSLLLLRQRLVLEHVQCRAAKPSAAQCLNHRRFVNHPARTLDAMTADNLLIRRQGRGASSPSRRKAIAASPDDAAELACRPDAPLLEISRVAYDLENKPVELRLSRCLTDSIHYISDLR